ncbi:MAG: hypothetical protein K8H87_14915 [Pseudorhodoplanes sp.]|nr:hypothetical protein [Pseudorhodoplanes sp.]
MDTGKNVRPAPNGREQIVGAVVEDGLTNAAPARQFSTTSRTVTARIHSDKGPEFMAATLRDRIAAVGAKTADIELGGP